MKSPLLLAPLVSFAVFAASAAEVQAPPAPAAEGAATQLVGAMATRVATFFNSSNPNPDPAVIGGALDVLKLVGRPDGLTREQAEPLIQRIEAAADRFAPEAGKPPSYGAASFFRLELLSGPLLPWLRDDQKNIVLRRQVEYGAKLSRQDEKKVDRDMQAMARMLQGESAEQDEAAFQNAVVAEEPGAGGDKIHLTLAKPVQTAVSGDADSKPALRIDDFSLPDQSRALLARIVSSLKNPTESRGDERFLVVRGLSAPAKAWLALAIAEAAGARLLRFDANEFRPSLIPIHEDLSRERLKNQISAKPGPVVVFIDRLEKFGPNPQRHEARSLEHLLRLFRGLGPDVVVVGSVAGESKLDAGLGEVFKSRIDIPALSLDEREAALRERTAGLTLALDVDLQAIAKMAEGYSAADLAVLVQRAQAAAATRQAQAVAGQDFEAAFRRRL